MAQKLRDPKPGTVLHKIMTLLADGEPHTREEVFACLSDELQAKRHIRVYMHRVRLLLSPRRETVVCAYVHSKRTICYRQLAFLDIKSRRS